MQAEITREIQLLSQKTKKKCRNRFMYVLLMLSSIVIFARLFDVMLSRFRKKSDRNGLSIFLTPAIIKRSGRRSKLFGFGEILGPYSWNGTNERSSSAAARPLLDTIDFNVVGDINISLKGASRVSKFLSDGSLEHQILEKDAPFLNLLITCNQSDYAHLYHALEITVLGSIRGAFTIGLRDWVNPCESDWASRPLTSMVHGQKYGVAVAGNRTVYYVPLNRFKHRQAARIRGFSLLGFKTRPGIARLESVRLTARRPPTAWVEPEAENLARVEYSCRRPGMLALCIDDGSDRSMSYVLDQLAAAKAPATFFQVGRHAGKSAERLAFARRALGEGHAIEHHTWRHDDASELAEAAVRDDLDRTRAQHRRLFRRELRYFRPPRGHFDAVLLGELARRNMSAVMWTYSVSDHGGASRATIWEAFLRAMARFRPDRHGLISVQHFSLNASVDLLPRMALTARQLGWRLVSLEECLRAPDADDPEPGPYSGR